MAQRTKEQLQQQVDDLLGAIRQMADDRTRLENALRSQRAHNDGLLGQIDDLMRTNGSLHEQLVDAREQVRYMAGVVSTSYHKG